MDLKRKNAPAQLSAEASVVPLTHPDLAIPCGGAPQQSPTPFRQASKS
jgi:hypothetical protein